MKQIVILLVLVFSSMALFGQAEQIRADIDFFTESLQIQDDQEQDLSKIIQKKYDDLSSISTLKNSNEQKFRQKRRVIYRLSDNSIRMILKEEQLEKWDELNRAKRVKNAALIKELQSKNANKEDLKDAQYGIVNE